MILLNFFIEYVCRVVRYCEPLTECMCTQATRKARVCCWMTDQMVWWIHKIGATHSPLKLSTSLYLTWLARISLQMNVSKLSLNNWIWLFSAKVSMTGISSKERSCFNSFCFFSQKFWILKWVMVFKNVWTKWQFCMHHTSLSSLKCWWFAGRKWRVSKVLRKEILNVRRSASKNAAGIASEVPSTMDG